MNGSLKAIWEVAEKEFNGKEDQIRFIYFMLKRFPPESYTTTPDYVKEWVTRIKEKRTYAFDKQSTEVYEQVYLTGVNV